MRFFESAQGWLGLLVLVVVCALVFMRRRSKAEAEAGSTLSPGQDAGSWELTAALPECSVCLAPMVLGKNARGQQAWTCATPGCKGQGS